MFRNSKITKIFSQRLSWFNVRIRRDPILRINNPQDLQKLLKEWSQNLKNKFDSTYELFQQNPKSRQYLMMFLGLTVGLIAVNYQMKDDFISFQDLFENHVKTDNVLQISINNQKNGVVAHAELSNGEVKTVQLGSVDNFLYRLEVVQLEKGKTKQTFIPLSYEKPIDSKKLGWYIHESSQIIFTLVLLVFLVKTWQQQGQNAMKEKKGFRIFGLGEKIKVSFDDVAGMSEVKTEISEFVDFLKNPKKYQQMGARLPKGALLTGPPGCGKTLLAKACAGEAGVPFITLSGSDFVEMFVGVGASRVGALFKKAKQHAPCIIFIDEIDAIGKKRDSMGGNDEKDNTLNQILVEMDGFGTDSQVIVMAATNRKDMLDSALIRPGRFDRQIEVGLPNLEERQEIFKIHLKPLNLDPSKSVDDQARRLSSLTPGFSGADIANLCNEAAILASRQEKIHVEAIDFEMASEKVLAGAQKKMNLTDLEKRTIAVHESGHAIISWFSPGCDPLVKITIIPRTKGSLGYAQYLPDENFIQNKGQLIDKLCFILGGRAAEQVFFNKVTTGASDDLQKVYDLAYQIVTKFGMSELGHQSFQDEQFEIKHSQETQNEIDQEVKKIVQECTQKSISLIQKYQDQVQRLSDRLIEKESLDLKQIIEVLGERPGNSKQNFNIFKESLQQN